MPNKSKLIQKYLWNNNVDIADHAVLCSTTTRSCKSAKRKKKFLHNSKLKLISKNSEQIIKHINIV